MYPRDLPKPTLNAFVVVWHYGRFQREMMRRIDCDWINGFNSPHVTPYVYEQPFVTFCTIDRSGFHQLKGLLAEYAEDDDDSVELVRNVRDRRDKDYDGEENV